MSMNLHRYSAGRYSNGTVTVERTPSGWRWQSCQDLSVGGEWRATKREALLDLDAYCSPEATAARSAARRQLQAGSTRGTWTPDWDGDRVSDETTIACQWCGQRQAQHVSGLCPSGDDRRCNSCGGTLRPTERIDGPALGGECSCWQGVR